MKKLILAIALVMTTVSFAQEKKKLSPEQQAELQVKKMTLDLDLDANQQKEIKSILLDQAQKRAAKMAEMKAKKEKGTKLSAAEKFAMRSKMLDEKIEQKAQMKKILKPEQFKKWNANQHGKKAKRHHKRQHRSAK